MKINWTALSEQDDVDINMWFQRPAMPVFFRRRLVRQYPEIKDGVADGLRDALVKIHRDNRPAIEARVAECKAFFDDAKMHEISDAFSGAFGIDCSAMLNDISGNIGTNPVCPRRIKENVGFDVPFFRDAEWILRTVLHEMVHFVWFRIWNEHFMDSWEEYEMPHLKWVLSEMIVDPIIRNSSLSKYFSNIENDQTIAYNYFYDMEIGGAPILKTLADFYKNNSITECMEKAYAYCVEHETELREKIAAAES